LACLPPHSFAFRRRRPTSPSSPPRVKNALDDAVKKYEAKTGDKVVVSYAASPALAKQIEQAAPADIFFSADLDWMDYLEQRKLIDPVSRHTLLGNTLVLVAPKDSRRFLEFLL
jgi:molybdate transport system substrate-binding protein